MTNDPIFKALDEQMKARYWAARAQEFMLQARYAVNKGDWLAKAEAAQEYAHRSAALARWWLGIPTDVPAL